MSQVYAIPRAQPTATRSEETRCRSISKSRPKPRRSAKRSANGCMTNASLRRRNSTPSRSPKCWARCGRRPARRGCGARSCRRNMAAWGLGPLANALVQMELGESMLGALSMNTQGPDDASMMTILAHGTEYQKEKFLKPLLNGDKRICFSMTEKAAGADATGMQTTRGQGRQRKLYPQRREVVLLRRQRRRHRAGDGQDRSERAAPQAILDLHRRAAEPRLQDQAQRREHGDRRPA